MLTLLRHSIADYICSVAFILVCKTTGISSPLLHTSLLHAFFLSLTLHLFCVCVCHLCVCVCISLLVLMMTSHVFMYCYWWCEARYIIRVRLWPMILCMVASWYCLTVLCMMHTSSMHAVMHILCLFQLSQLYTSLSFIAAMTLSHRIVTKYLRRNLRCMCKQHGT